MIQKTIHISVIICTHNPRVDYLERTLEGLKAQALPCEDWEFLLIDNASNEPVKDRFDLSWHPNGRHVLEKELGLTAARLRGIDEATAPLLVFVDDDNILETNYLTEVLRISELDSNLGVFGGSCLGEFEVDPADHIRPFLGHIAIKHVEEAQWGNFISWGSNMPVGAGMVVRSLVAQAYRNNLRQDPFLKVLGRKGKSLASCEDTDIIIAAHSLGYSSGVFPELRLTHLIPAFRLEDDYILRLIREGTASLIILEYIRFDRIPVYAISLIASLKFSLRYACYMIQDPFKARIMAARRAGCLNGVEMIREIAQENVETAEKYPITLGQETIQRG